MYTLIYLGQMSRVGYKEASLHASGLESEMGLKRDVVLSDHFFLYFEKC